MLVLVTDGACTQQVPMDWQDPSNDQKVVIAIMRLRATDTRDYRGPVFFNPGVSQASHQELIFTATDGCLLSGAWRIRHLGVERPWSAFPDCHREELCENSFATDSSTSKLK